MNTNNINQVIRRDYTEENGTNDSKTLHRSKRFALVDGYKLASEVSDYIGDRLDECLEDEGSSSWLESKGRTLLRFVPFMETIADIFFDYDIGACSLSKNYKAIKQNSDEIKKLHDKVDKILYLVSYGQRETNGDVKMVENKMNRNNGAIMRVENKVDRNYLGLRKVEDEVDRNLYLLSYGPGKNNDNGSNVDDSDLYFLGYGLDRNYNGINQAEGKVDRNLYVLRYGVDTKPDTVKSVGDNVDRNLYVLGYGLDRNLKILGNGLDRNLDSIRNNFQAINANYQAIKLVEDKVDRNLYAILERFTILENKAEETKNRMTEEFKKLHGLVKKSKIENVTSKIITFIEFLLKEQDSIKQLPKDQLLIKLKGEGTDGVGILHRLQDTRTPLSASTLHVNLYDIINQKFAIPEDAYDEIAFTALDLLYSGTQAYVSVMYFLVQGYGYLANYYYQKKAVENYNNHLSLLSLTTKDFINSLSGSRGLFGKVIDIFDEVQQLHFIQEEREDIIGVLEERKRVIRRIKSEFNNIRDLPESKPDIPIHCSFSTSKISTPMLEWRDGKSVSYAIQFKNGSSYSQISDWSRPYEISGKANPLLDVGTDVQGRDRLIFRKFDDRTPELVGTIRDSNQRKFRDVNHDLYNVVMRSNERKAIQEIDILLKGGADINAEYPGGRSIMHAAAESGSSSIVFALMKNGADIDAKDKDGRTPLYIASELGHPNLVKDLITRGPDVNAKTSSGWTPLHAAVHKGNEDVVKILLENRSIRHLTTQGGFTPLHVACSSGKDAIIHLLLLDSKVDINAASDEGLTPLHLATIGGYDSSVKLLLKSSKINVNAKAKGDLTSLHFASSAGNLRIVKFLIAQSTINVNEKSVDGLLPLHLAITFEKEDVALELLKVKGIDVDSKGKSGSTPLHLAAMKGQNNVVSSSIDKQALIDEMDEFNLTPLHVAAEKGHLDVVKTLVDKANASLNVEQQDGYTPLALAVLSGKLNTVKFLAQKGASVKTKNKSGLSLVNFAAWKGDLDMIRFLEQKGVELTLALHWAAYGGELRMVKYLIEVKGQPVNIKDNNGKIPIHDAAKQGNLNVVRYLVHKGADLTLRDNNGNSIMHFATLSGNLNLIKYLVKSGGDINSVNNYNTTLLHLASLNGFLDIVKYLVEEKNAEMDRKNNDERAAIHFAASNGYLRIVKYLQARGANINHSNYDGWTPTLEAAYAGHWSTVKLLANKDLENDSALLSSYSALHFAARDGQSKMINFLLAQNGYNVDVTDRDGRTPAFWAVSYGRFDALRLLVEEKNANCGSVDSSGTSLLHRAVYSDNLDMVKYIVDKDVDISAKDNDDKTPLDVARERGKREIAQLLTEKAKISNIFDAAKNGRLDVMKYFVEDKNTNVDIKNSHDETSLHFAATKGHLEVISYLVKRNADVNARDLYGRTPLHLVARGGYLKAVKFLINSGANLNEVDEGGRTLLDCAVEYGNLHIVKYIVEEINSKVKSILPLHLTAKEGYLEIMKFLVSYGANINEVDWAGQTPLHRAAEAGHLDIVKYLVNDKKVDYAIKNSDGETPLDVAKARNRNKVVEFLNNQKLFFAAESNISKFGELNNNVAKIIIKDNEGRNLVHYASAYGRLDIIKNLEEELGENIYLTDKNGWTSLHHAVHSGDLDTIKYFVEKEGARIITFTDNDQQSPLHIAVHRGDLNIVQYLIDKGADTWVKDSDGETPLDVAREAGHSDVELYLMDKESIRLLLDAAKSGNLIKVKSMLADKKVDINSKDINGWTPLHFAAYQGHLDVVMYLIYNGADINALENSSEHKKPIHVAALGGHKSVIEYLLNKGALTIDASKENGWQPLHYASWKGDLESVEFLINRRWAKIGAVETSNDGKQPIHVAAREGHENIIKLLLSKGASVNDISNGNGWKPIHYAAWKGDVETVKFLVDEGADVLAVEAFTDGKKPLHIAAREGHGNVIEFLLRQGASVDSISNGNGWLPLHYAAQGDHVTAAQILINNGADVHPATNNDMYPIHIAAQYGQTNMIEFLLRKGANVNDVTRGPDRFKVEGLTPLHFAAEEGQLPAAHLLIAEGANVNAAEDGWTPLHKAACRGHLYVAQLLVGYGANIHAREKDFDGLEPVHWAAWCGQKNIIQYLLSKGASVDDTSWDESTPLHYAAAQGHLEATQFLVDKGGKVHSVNDDGRKPIHLAASNSHKNVFGFLLSKEDNVDANGFFALVLPYFANYDSSKGFDFIEYLFHDIKINIYSTDDDGWTLLHHAVYNFKLPLVRYLVENEGAADVIYSKNSDGKTPLDIAEEFSSPDIVEYFTAVSGARRDRRSIESKTSSKYVIAKPLDVNNLSNIKNESVNMIFDTPVLDRQLGAMNRKSTSKSAAIVGDRDCEIDDCKKAKNKIMGDERPIANSMRNKLTVPVEEENDEYREEFSESAKNSGESPSSWINNLLGWVQDSVGSLFASRAALPEAKSNAVRSMSGPMDVNGTIMLLDLMIRKVTGEKYISTAESCMSPIEAQGYAINILRKIETVVGQAALKSEVSIHQLQIDYIGMQKEITGKVMSGETIEIAALVKSYIEKACTTDGAGYLTRLCSKKLNKFNAECDKALDGIMNPSFQQKMVINEDDILQIGWAQKQQIISEPKCFLSDVSGQGRLN